MVFPETGAIYPGPVSLKIAILVIPKQDDGFLTFPKWQCKTDQIFEI